MNPQHSSSAQADLRWRDSLQAMFCTDYSIMHDKAFNKIGLRQCSSPGTGFLFDKIGSWITDAPIDDPSNLYPVLKVMRVTYKMILLGADVAPSILRHLTSSKFSTA